MGQAECLRVLNKKWQSTKQIAQKLKQESGSVCNSLNRLYKHNEVLRKKLKIECHNSYFWRKK